MKSDLTTPTIDALEVKDAVAQETLNDLPKQDGMITLNSFTATKLTSGTVTVPTTMPTTEPEPIPEPVVAPSPAIERFKDSDFEKL